ncbi:hypothetical protein LIER_05546 [Lithospermum erythrorhizon]|uniref:Polyprotein n=1 Tax=Lithospermum erythrorhizon TaxID=34254 RepID=A0AAV3P4Z5_LITER
MTRVVMTKCYNWWKENRCSQKADEGIYNNWTAPKILDFDKLFIEENFEKGTKFFIAVKGKKPKTNRNKSKGPKTCIITKKKRTEEPVFNLIPISCIPRYDTTRVGFSTTNFVLALGRFYNTDDHVVELSNVRAEPTVVAGVDDTLIDDVVKMQNPEDAGAQEEATKLVAEEQMPIYVRPIASDSWKLIDEQPDSNDEDIEAVMRKRRKAKGKLKIDENRTRVRNKRIPKNADVVSTTDVILSTNEEKVGWKFGARRRIDVERMLSEATKKNADIMGILKSANVMPTVKIVGPYYPKLLKEFFFNMTIDIDDPESPKFQKGTHVTDIPLRPIKGGGPSGEGQGKAMRIISNEIKYLDRVIQTNLVRKSELEARVRSLTEYVDPYAVDSEADASQN